VVTRNGDDRHRSSERDAVKSKDERRLRTGYARAGLVITVLALLATHVALAQTFPTKPIRIVNTEAPGGNSDED
jgi:hypothetical protein